MVKFKVCIVESEKNKDGKHNVKIRVTHKRDARYIRTDYYVRENEFDGEHGLILPGGDYSADNADKANRKIQIITGQLATKVDKQQNLRFMDMASLMEVLRDKRQSNDFYAIMDRRIEKLRREGKTNYAGLFETTKTAIQQYHHSPVLPIEYITYGFLNKLEDYWRYERNLKDSSIGYYMRNIRTIWNQGRKNGVIDDIANPFLNYEIPKGEPRENMVLTPTEMATIAKVPIKDPLMEWSRDMYMLMFCLIGVNPKDIFHATSLVRGRLFYTRSKGKKKYSVKVPPQALHIIYRYPGKETLVNVLDNYADYRSAVKRINKKIQALAEQCEIKKHITIYTGRHSWSAYARYLGISKWDIAAALGHLAIDLPKVTEFYDHIEEEQRRVDDANRKVIRLILRTRPKQIPF